MGFTELHTLSMLKLSCAAWQNLCAAGKNLCAAGQNLCAAWTNLCTAGKNLCAARQNLCGMYPSNCNLKLLVDDEVFRQKCLLCEVFLPVFENAVLKHLVKH